jgi:LemA protein
MPDWQAVLLLGVVTTMSVVVLYNRLVRDRNQVRAAWADIDVQLKRRHDLVPQLVTVVKAYADYEQATLLAVTELRSRSEAARHLPEKATYEDALGAGVQELVVLAEDYPELAADENFRQLQAELTEVEDHLQYSRRFYNGAVRIYNTRVQSFPHLLVARPLGFQSAEYFAVDDARERNTPAVELG